MTALSWDTTTKRRYNTGIDRGVLYIGQEPGVPWAGLVSVTKKPTSREVSSYFIDGVKYLTVASAGDFEATLEAFYSPPEFDQCEGLRRLPNGLIVDDQPSIPFGLSYRSTIGNDTQGTAFGYKIHLIYGALATPSDSADSTLTNSNSLSPLSWDLTMLPPILSGTRPSAHFIIDTSKIDPIFIPYVEGILYGNVNADARLPSVSELYDIFDLPDPPVRRNLCVNPRMTAGVGPTALPSANYTITQNVPIPGGTPHPLGIATALRSVVTASGAGGSNIASINNVDGLGNTSTRRGAGVWALSPVAGTVYVDTFEPGSPSQMAYPIAANTWTYCPIERPGISWFSALIVRGSGTAAQGETCYFTGAIAEAGRSPDYYFDGGLPDVYPWTHDWEGAANTSVSKATVMLL